jgi:signal recognition particle subunit SRP54
MTAWSTCWAARSPTGLNLALNPPSVILMAGLQGSGKTTTTGKLALRLSKFERKKVLVASLDTRRPAAMEQLAMLAKQVEVESLPIVAGQSAADIAKRALPPPSWAATTS